MKQKLVSALAGAVRVRVDLVAAVSERERVKEMLEAGLTVSEAMACSAARAKRVLDHARANLVLNQSMCVCD